MKKQFTEEIIMTNKHEKHPFSIESHKRKL